MSAESTDNDPYDVVLCDLRAKRDELDQTIQALERMRGISPATGVSAGSSRAAGAGGAAPKGAVPDEGPGAFLGMSIADAAIKLLKTRRRQLSNSEILAAITAGGVVLTSADPLNTVGSVLTRRFHQVGDIVRVSRGVWGLAEWYPNRNFKRKDNDPKASSSASEPPSGQGASDPAD